MYFGWVYATPYSVSTRMADISFYLALRSISDIYVLESLGFLVFRV